MGRPSVPPSPPGDVRVERDGPTAVVVLDRPSARNALDDGLRRALLARLTDLTAQQAVRAIVLTGDGGSFCAGGDVGSMPTDAEHIERRLGEMHAIVRLIHSGPKPVVAAVEGAAFGSGLSLAVAADVLVGASDARFGCSFSRLGLVADTALLWTLPRKVGGAAARRILLSGSVLTGEDAAAAGMVDEVVEPGGALERALSQARVLAAEAPLAVAATKRILSRPGCDLDASLSEEMAAQLLLLGSRDFREGRSAFFERRDPTFVGE